MKKGKTSDTSRKLERCFSVEDCDHQLRESLQWKHRGAERWEELRYKWTAGVATLLLVRSTLSGLHATPYVADTNGGKKLLLLWQKSIAIKLLWL